MAHGSALMLMLIEYMKRCNAMLAVHEQEVRWYWCMFEFECVIKLFGIIVRFTTAPSQLHSRLQFNYNNNYIRFCAGVDVD